MPSSLQSKAAAADHPGVLLLDRRPEHHLRLGARSPDPPQVLGNERRPAQLKPGLPVRPRGLADAAKTPGVHQEGSLDRHVGHRGRSGGAVPSQVSLWKRGFFVLLRKKNLILFNVSPS